MLRQTKSWVSAIWIAWSFLTVLLFFPAMGGAGDDPRNRAVALGTITVTAEKQEENIQDVSSSIVVMDLTDIEDKKIDSMADVIDFVPNMMIFNDGMTQVNKVTTRGISAPTMARNMTSTGMYIDGVPTLGSYGYEEGLLDIERIEVLRGPQGTLYGKNTEAGAINIITRQPGNEFKRRVSAEAGQWLSSASDDKWLGGASLNMSGPIAEDKLFFSLAGEYKHKDGFMYNTFTDAAEFEQNKSFARGKLRWTPTDQLDISLLMSYLDYRYDGANNMNLTENGAAMFGIPVPDPRKVSSDLDGWQKSTNQVQSLKIDYDLNASTRLTAVTSRKKTTFDAALDFDYSSAFLMHSEQDGTQEEKIAQELRLAQSSDKLNWLIGLYYDSDDRDTRYDGTSAMPSMVYELNTDLTGQAFAVFGQAGYLLTEKLKVMAGLRYEHQAFELERNFAAGQLDDSWEKLSPKIAAEYQLMPDVMIYATVAEGYRSGGFNEMAMDPQYTSYEEESLWSYEIGMKSLFMDQRVMVNMALFYMDISDMQVEENIDPYTSYITNAAKATSKGVEIDLTYQVTDTFSLMGGFGYTLIEFDDFSDANGNYKGNKNPYAPDYSFNIGAQYRHPNGFYARADLIGYGEMYFDKSNRNSRDAYQIVNAKIGYEMERFDIYLYGKNIFDQEYNSNGYYAGSYVVCSSPGELGLQVVARF